MFIAHKFVIIKKNNNNNQRQSLGKLMAIGMPQYIDRYNRIQKDSVDIQGRRLYIIKLIIISDYKGCL